MGQQVLLHSLEGCSGVASAKGDNSEDPRPVEERACSSADLRTVFPVREELAAGHQKHVRYRCLHPGAAQWFALLHHRQKVQGLNPSVWSLHVGVGAAVKHMQRWG